MKDQRSRASPRNCRVLPIPLEEIAHLLEDVPDATASKVITFLAFTGLRQSDARSVRSSDWDESNRKLYIRRAVWQTKVGGTKNEDSEDSIPVVPILQEDAGVAPWPGETETARLCFRGRTGAPLNFHNRENRVIKPGPRRKGETERDNQV